MSGNHLRITEPAYYNRDYDHDIPEHVAGSWNETAARVAMVALSFVSLYKPLSFPLSLALGSLRVYSNLEHLYAAYQKGELQNASWEFVQTTVSVIALAGTIFAHPLGMLITTGHDFLLELCKLIDLLQKGQYEPAIESIFKIANNAIYFALFFTGGIEMAALSLVMQMVLGLYLSQKEFREGKYIEGAGHVLMSFVRGNQLYGQAQLLQRKWEIEALLDKVGKEGLGDKWQFPSDHLPVGAKVGNATVLSWNVLNKNFIDWVYNNSQGLNGSMLTQLDKPSATNPNLTIREELVIQYILEMIQNPNHPNLIFALQECHPEFARALIQALPAHIGAITTDPTFKQIDLNITLYDKSKYTLIEAESSIVWNAFPNSDTRRPLMDTVFQEIATGQKFQVVNVHIPGDPNKPGREEFARYLITHERADCATVGAGDMNFPHDEMQTDIDKVSQGSSHFVNLVDYNTNISPYVFNGKSIDHIWVSTKHDLLLQSMMADEVWAGLQKTVDLITEELRAELRMASQKEWPEEAQHVLLGGNDW